MKTVCERRRLQIWSFRLWVNFQLLHQLVPFIGINWVAMAFAVYTPVGRNSQDLSIFRDPAF